MTSYQDLLVERCGDRVLRIRLNRPQVLNAMSENLVAELQQAFLESQSPPSPARCLIITGAGRAFSSGADLGSSNKAAVFETDVGTSLDRGMNPVMEALFALPIPIVVAVNGVAAGAGCSLALAGDFIIAARSASFLQAFVNVGLVPDCGATWILPRAIGRSRALEMMMLGEPLSAEKAETWGLVNRVVDDTSLAQTALAVATQLANGPTKALGEIRRLVRRSMESSLSQALQDERQAQSRSGRTSDFSEGVQAFIEKRTAVFTGR